MFDIIVCVKYLIGLRIKAMHTRLAVVFIKQLDGTLKRLPVQRTNIENTIELQVFSLPPGSIPQFMSSHFEYTKNHYYYITMQL